MSTTNTHVRALAEILENLEEVEKDDEVIKYRVENTEDSDKIFSALSELDYTREKGRTLRDGILTISFNASSWASANPVFRSWKELHERVSEHNKVPSFIIFEELSASGNTEHCNCKRLQLLCSCRKLLAKLADHCEPQNGIAAGRNRVLFLIDAETLTYKYDLIPSITWEELSGIKDVDGSLEAINKLLTAISLDDSQDTERRSVMRSAFAEVMSASKADKASFLFVMSSLKALFSKYTEHHELFINRFSVNKVIQEIGQQDLQYTSKINEIIAGAQAKALTIPGALIAISAAMKIDSTADAVAVSVGLLITTVIVHLGTSVHIDTYSHIKKKIKNEFQRYDCLAEKAEIRKRAENTKDDLLTQAASAQINLSRIRIGIWLSLIAALIYIAISYCSSIETAPEAKPTTGKNLIEQRVDVNSEPSPLLSSGNRQTAKAKEAKEAKEAKANIKKSSQTPLAYSPQATPASGEQKDIK